ncbi:MAG: hypothetical protein P4L69_21305 [Desulfosporosinus sp.]|nr:hypothetical protein [Desulfosporosinus sp.]
MKVAKILGPIIVVFTLLGCGTAKSQSTTPTKTQPPQAQTSTSQVQTAATNLPQSPLVKWIGIDVDNLGPNDLKPDGKPDGHFHLTVPFTQPSAVKSIWIRYSEFGKSFKWGWIYNKNLPTNSYMMAVFDNVGKPILPQADNGYRVDGLTDFDVFISELNNENGRDTIKFEKNQTFNFEIDYVIQNNDVKEFDCSTNIT